MPANSDAAGAHREVRSDSSAPTTKATTTPSPQLPSAVLGPLPVVYAGCCLALSAPLVSHLVSLLPAPPRLSLSIGSGYGLLEAHLLSSHPTPNLIGVEVQPSSNRFLPRPNHREVYGTRGLDHLADEAHTWLLVYPRRVGLLDEYLKRYGHGALRTVIWIGPNADWTDYMPSFASPWEVQVQDANEVGGRACEIIAVARRS
ncbi:hypothetical protein BCR34DRAFT_477985 [Clohesyomyces aquaticus]|uniref:S-adenosyl-L-methionine-dependent methyltransferase n=1 Tax=Clohesyomyces aquaticus TaxID=1231657 RepID=A0A1Y2A096_9PLEO|nr:hypothetical protein BCR34DRAFT_477985 [Clohesyomyces aquaticus]